MKIVVFGLSISSSWGNGHATLWRGLCAALARRGHRIVFFEKDVPYYASCRDLHELPGGRLYLYPDWGRVRELAARELLDADVGMVTSYCPDGRAAAALVLSSAARLRVFYDTPVTLDRLRSGHAVDYIPEDGLSDFDLVLSYTGGRALELLRTLLGARSAVPLYGSVDPALHRPVPPAPHYRADLSYLGTYAADRDAALRTLFVETARRLPNRRFVLGGAQYDAPFPWQSNIHFVYHVPPADHPVFYSSSAITLNVTRKAMAEMGYCPSGRLFEAAACGVPILSDTWEGLDRFFAPEEEVLLARTTDEAIAALDRSPEDLARIARRARERVLACHTADIRAIDLENALTQAASVHAGAA
jgi:spore maturation protein CgeB